MRAALQMYDLPQIRAATDALWAAVRQALAERGFGAVPEELTRDTPAESLWLAGDMLFSQTCGYPLTHQLKGRVTLLATPVYRLQGRDTSDYCSLILVRDDDAAGELEQLRGRRAAYNGETSQSGYSALRHAVAPIARNGRFFSATACSGGHLNAMDMVRGGDADCCAVDAVTWSLAAAHDPERVAGLRILAETAWAPNLPYITRKDITATQLAEMRAALAEAVGSPQLQQARTSLLLQGIEVRPLADYRKIDDMESEAIDLGYPSLA